MPLTKLALRLLALPRSAKRAVALAVDVSLIVLTVWIAFYLRLDEWVRLSGSSCAGSSVVSGNAFFGPLASR